MTKIFLAFMMMALVACNGGGGTTSNPGPKYNVTGKVTYDYVPITTSGLNYAGTTQKPIRKMRIEARNPANNAVVARSTTDDSGNYTLAVPQSLTSFYIAVISQMTSPAVQVEDNTNNNALYLARSADISLTGDMAAPDFNAPSGWDGSNLGGSYTGTRAAAPFAILDSIYEAYSKIKTARPSISVPALKVNWSVNNTPTGGNVEDGDIGTSYYDGSELYILGQANVDSDEYDKHVIVHEYGHFIEDKLSRSDSIGGQHGSGDLLNKSVAFGEGFGNAFSAMVFDPENVYRDSAGSRQQTIAISMNMESGTDSNPGWYSEFSVQQILYDIFDNNNDAGDTLNLGIGPVFDVLMGAQKTTNAFTSIFSFIKALKNANASSVTAIDAITSNKNIDPVLDIYGSGESNDGGITDALPVYNQLTSGATVNKVLAGGANRINEQANTRFFKFTASSSNSRLEWTNSDGFIFAVFYRGAYMFEEYETAMGSGSRTFSTVSGREYTILMSTDSDFTNGGAPVTVDLKYTAL